MLLAHGIEKRVGIADIETLKELFDVGILNVDTGEWIEFEVSAYKNELYEFVKWYTSKPLDYLVTFNGIGFDQQVLQYVVDNYQKWYDLTSIEITGKIHEYAQRVIENSRYGLFQQYKEHQFSIAPLDVFKIHHFDNEAKMTSLKWCAFMMNMDVEEMPIHHSRTKLTEEEVRLIRSYRRNDCIVTQGVLYLTLGQVDKIKEINGGFELPELKDYQGKNKIQDRFDVKKETGLECLNWSDVKIGEEWNKQDYMSAEGIKDPSLLFPKKVKHPFGRRFSTFFPKTMHFTTDKLQKFINNLGNSYVKNEKQEFQIIIGNTTYTIAKGGIHSCEKNRMIIPQSGFILRDADVGSQYPNSILKLEIYAPHLKRTIIVQFEGKIVKRISYKKEGTLLKKAGKEEEARPYMSVQEMLKLCLNGGYYGKLGQKGSFLEYPEGLLKVCIGNEIEILMLVEMMEEAGFQVVSGNTDGIVTYFPEEREEDYNRICKEWEKKVGNTKSIDGVVLGELEYTDFKGLWQDSINSYIAKKVDPNTGKVSSKKKGRFMTEFEMHKNKSKRVIPLALEAYFIHGTDPVEFVRNHSNIFDFCIAKKASGLMHYEEQWEEQGVTKIKKHKKLVRYFISKEGTVLYKRGFNHDGKPMNNHCEAPTELGQPKVTYFNKPFKKEDYGIDYDYYILEVLERIDNIQKTKKKKAYIDSKNPGQQLTLF